MTAEAVAAPARRDARTSVSTFVPPVAPLRRAEAPRPNAPCACGSGRKAKKCCLARETDAQTRGSVANAPSKNLASGHEANPKAADETASAPLPNHAGRTGSVASQRQPADTAAIDATGMASAAIDATEMESAAIDATGMASADIDATEPNAPRAPANLLPLRAEGAGCAAWMRLTGLYPWKPLSLAERRAGLDKLTRYVRHWMRARRAAGAFRPLLAHDPRVCPSPADAPEVDAPGGAAARSPDADAALEALLATARTHAEPSWELAEELEISEAKLNQLCREHTGLSARAWWDAVRAPDACKAIRAEIESALDGMRLDRSAQIRRRGVQVMDLHRALRQQRRAAGSSATERAWNLGFQSAARLNLALWRATGRTMQQLEAEILLEIFGTWDLDHRTCRLCARIADDQMHHGAHGDHGNGGGEAGGARPAVAAWEPVVRIA